ncbi:MAG TPA: YajQ family cyclic di-GMP-binding protein [Vicinamibacteria bacterium]|nr:YajQ family cyclic di-GMP-binding protein [Vicinamibacteria bacterium]
MADEHSFDVVSEVDLQEVKNALQQAMKEIQTRFDLKGSHTEIQLSEGALELSSIDEFKLKSALDILKSKLVKRQVSLKALRPGNVESALGGTARQRIELQNGIPIEKGREIVKLIKNTKLKVQASIQGDQLRVTGKNKDDLQKIIQLLRDTDLDIHMEFTNYR